MKILVAGWDSGGGVEAVQTVVRRAIERGHDVRVLGTEGLRSRFEAAGATFCRYRSAPDNDTSRAETDLVKDWETSNPLSMFQRVAERLMCGPASEFSRDVADELQRGVADVVVVDTLIPAAAFGAQAAGVPTVLLMHGTCTIPRPGAPMLFAGFEPPRGGLGRLRDRAGAAVTLTVMHSWIGPLNRVRAECGLRPVVGVLDLFGTLDRILVCSSPSYDFGSDSVPPNVRYVGPQVECYPGGAATLGESLVARPGRPLVLVGLSSTVMRQETVLQRAADALGSLDVSGLITTGPAIDPAVVKAPPNVAVVPWARHADVLPHCSAVITHGGHGTVMKALIAGVPQVVVPLGRDQPDNAARVAHLGAGVRVRNNASAAVLRAAVAAVLADSRYGDAAAAASARLRAERNDDAVIDELEHVAVNG